MSMLCQFDLNSYRQNFRFEYESNRCSCFYTINNTQHIYFLIYRMLDHSLRWNNNWTYFCRSPYFLDNDSTFILAGLPSTSKRHDRSRHYACRCFLSIWKFVIIIIVVIVSDIFPTATDNREDFQGNNPSWKRTTYGSTCVYSASTMSKLSRREWHQCIIDGMKTVVFTHEVFIDIAYRQMKPKIWTLF
jgi:hypothetical protein